MKTGLVNLDNILEAPKGKSGNNQSNNNFNKVNPNIWDL